MKPLTDSSQRVIADLTQIEEEIEGFSLLFGASPFGIVIHNLDGSICSANPAAEKILGLTLDQVKGRSSIDPCWKAVHEDGSEFPGETHPAMEALATGCSIQNVTMGVFNPNEEAIRWIQVSATPLFKAGEPTPYRVMATFVDITERKQAELALERSERTYRALFNGMLNGVAYCQMLFEDGEPKDWIYLAVNEAFQTQTGLKDVVGKKASEVIPGIREADPKIFEIYARVAASGNPESFEMYIEALQAWFKASVFSPELGNFVAVFDVITERKKAELELAESKALFEGVVESIPLMIFLKEPTDLKFVIFNRAGEEMLGIDRADFLGKNNLDLFPPEQAAHFMADDRAVINGELGLLDIPEEPVLTIKNGTRLLHTRKVCLPGADGTTKYLLGISEDITEKKQMEEEKAKLQARLQQAQKMESLGTMAGGIAHDMNNVLGAILGLASANIEGQSPGSPIYHAFDTISKAATRGGGMVKSLLRFASQGPTEEQELDLNTLLEEQVHLLKRTTLSKVHLDMDLELGLKPIRGDSSALTHAFMNLCINGVHAMTESGTLTLRTRNVDNDWIEVTVKDTGIGMSKEVLDRALEPFFTTKEVGKGTGLGLALVYSTVKAHRGQIEIQSEPGKGTVIRLRFPACEPGTKAPKQDHAPHSTIPARALNVLLVDDDELIHGSIPTLLQTLGHTVFTTQCGEEALATIEAGFEPDVVILDINMPGLGGSGTLPRLRTMLPKVPVLLATGRADQAALDLAQAYPSVTLLPKPYSSKDLQQCLKSLELG